MKFKSPGMKDQLDSCPGKLQELATYADAVSRAQTKKPICITRVFDPVTGESGVHLARRAFDVRIEFVDEFGNGKRYYTKDEAEKIQKYVNSRYPRKDGKLTCLIHSFNGGCEHMHFQITAEMAKQEAFKE